MKDISTLTSDQYNYNCKIILDNGKSINVFADWLHNENLDHWKGWSCNAGVTRLSITENFDVYSARCNNNYLGNLKTGWNLLEKNICKQERCNSCTDDLLIEKSKSND